MEVAVTMMLKWLKSGIQDLEEVVKEMWMKQETIPRFFKNWKKVSLKILTYIMEHWF